MTFNKNNIFDMLSSVVDPERDPDTGRSDPNLLAGSGSKMNLKQNYSEKLIISDNFSTKMLNKKKLFPKQIISRHNMKPNTLTRREYKGKIYVKNIRRKKSFRIHNTDVKDRITLSNSYFTRY